MQRVSSHIFAMCMLGFCASVCLGSAYAASGWVATSTRAVPLRTDLVLSPLPADKTIRVALGLKPRNQSQFTAHARAVNTPGNPAFGHFLTPQQLTDAYAPTPDQVAALTSYLARNGFYSIKVAPNRLLVTAMGNAGAARTAFNTNLVQYTINGKTFFANTTDAKVPLELSDTVRTVLGLDNVFTPHFNHQTALRPSPKPAPGIPDPCSIDCGYSPQQLQTAYGADLVPEATNTTIGLFLFGDLGDETGQRGHTISDLRTFEDTAYHLPEVPYQVIKVGSDHSNLGGEGEWQIDTQSSSGMAGDVKMMYLYDGVGFNSPDLADEWNKIVSDGLAKSVSASYGGCEILSDLGPDDDFFTAANLQGQAIFASSGDAGASCFNAGANGVPAGVPGVEYPATSPWVIAVGGTDLVVNFSDGTYDTEAAWYAGGGGTSILETAPDWQANDVPAVGLTGLRGVPDIAMTGDPLTGELIVDNGAWGNSISGGTSLSSPLAMGAWARIQSAHCDGLGFPAPLFYALDSALGATGFHDVLIGNNVAYPAGPGWDYTTGLGSFDTAALNAALPGTISTTCVSTNNRAPIVNTFTASTYSGAPGLRVNFTAGATDPDGDTIKSYTFNFGDGSAPVAPVGGGNTASHTYSGAGTFNATVKATDSNGAPSLAAGVTINVSPVVVSACSVPGQGLVGDDPTDAKDPTGSTAYPLGGTDLAGLAIAEPYSGDGTPRLVFVLTTNKFGPVLQPAANWYVSFNAPDGKIHAVRMLTDAIGTPSFQSYKVAPDGGGGTNGDFVDGTPTTAEPASYYDPSGKIYIVVKASDVGVGPGQFLSGFVAGSRQVVNVPVTIDTGVIALGDNVGSLAIDNMPDDQSRQGSFAVYDDASCAGINSGLGTFGPVLQVSPTSLSFDSQAVKTSSPPKTVTLTNTGTAKVSIDFRAIVPTDFTKAGNCPTSLAPGAHCTMSVTFTPAMAGSRTGTLAIVSNAPNSPSLVGLSGTGVAAAQLSVSPQSLDFGDQPVNTSSVAKPVTLTNIGTASVSIEFRAIIPTDFTKAGNCPTSLAPGKYCTMNITFKPIVSGSRTGTLAIVTNASSNPSLVGLSGNGTQ